MLDVLHELLNLVLHFLHTLAHLKNDSNAADVHAEIAGERQDELQPLQIFIGVEAGVGFWAAWFYSGLPPTIGPGLGRKLQNLPHPPRSWCAPRISVCSVSPLLNF